MDSNDAPAIGGLDHADMNSRSFAPVLVGRLQEQQRLRAELELAVGGNGRIVIIGGEAGIGKTALSRDLANTATSLGVRVLVGSCFDLTSSPPYGPWLDLFEACQREPSLPPPPFAFADGQLAPVSDQAALFADVRRFFDNLASDRPVLVVLEDFHWADPASLDLLRHIGPHLRHWPAILLVTYRSDELVSGHPLTQHLPALVREADGARFDLHRLDGDGLRSLAAARHRLVPEDEDRLLDYLERHADGNPFFAIELLRTLEEEGVLQTNERGSAIAALDRVMVPTLLRQVIDGRVGRLGKSTRTALAIAAVIGYEVPLALWAAIAELTEEELFDTVERAVEAHLLEAEPDGTRVRFVHALTREALYEGILPPRRRIWHRRIAEALMASARVDTDSVAFHFQKAGDPRAAAWLIQAGERAQSAYAWLTAANRFQAAAALLEGIEGEEGTHRRLILRPCYLLRFSYPADAIGDLDMAARLAVKFGDAYLSAEVRNLRGLHLCYADRFRAGLVDMEQGIGAVERLPPVTRQLGQSIREWLSDAFTGRARGQTYDEQIVARVHAAEFDYRRSYQAWILAASGHLDTARATGQRFIDTFGDFADMPGGIRVASGFAKHALATAFAGLGRPVDARRLWTGAREELGEIDHHVLVAFMLLDELSDVALTYGAAEPVTRRRLASAAEVALERAVGALRPGVSPQLARIRCLVADGEWDEARQILDELPPPGNAFLRRETTIPRATLARHRGEPDTAWAEILPLLPQGPATEPGDGIHQEGLALLRLAADLALDAGNLPEAEAWLTAHDRWLDWSGAVLGRADGQLAWGRYHRADGNVGRARAHLGDALALAEAPEQSLVLVGTHRLMGEIDAAADQIAAARAHLATALGLAETCEVPFERALTLLALADLPDAGDADALVEEASEILATLGAVPALARARNLAARLAAATRRPPRPFSLTERELDVLRLIAEGRSNPEIAGALFISRRTAATHVSHILHKLDVGTRAEAVDHAHRHDLL